MYMPVLRIKLQYLSSILSQSCFLICEYVCFDLAHRSNEEVYLPRNTLAKTLSGYNPHPQQPHAIKFAIALCGGAYSVSEELHLM